MRRLWLGFASPPSSPAEGALLGRDRPEIGDGALETLRERDLGLPAEAGARQGDVGPARLRIVDGQRFVEDRALASHRGADRLGELEDRHLLRVADVAGLAEVALEEPPDP